MPDALQLSDTARQRVKPISGITPAQSRVRLNLGGLVQAYRALPMTKKDGWQRIANTLNDNSGRVGTRKVSPANAFVTLNSGLLAVGLRPLSDAPGDLNAPPILPRLTVDASVSHVYLVCAGYADAVLLLASPPAPASKRTFPDKSFRVIGSVSALTSPAPTDITGLYEAVYGAIETGSQIAVKLIATGENGVRLPPLIVVGVAG